MIVCEMEGSSSARWMTRLVPGLRYDHEVLGGLSIMLVGDPGQLPPVAEKPLYHSKPMTSLGEQGHLAYHMLTNRQCD